ncbi:MAG: precorrin-4 C(11)-methyltransferase [Thermoproteota archaeon]|jgi:precorrin-4/cobalt-precorrin-4 C11-methyltransferase|nr:precorrin-4 C(11)-methyltransferase [Thermoproteota archaeon]
MIQKNTVYFVGSGPGDPDLITIKAKTILENADVIIYSGSLLNPELLKYAKKNAQLFDAAKLDRIEIYEILRDSTKNNKLAIRFHDGDPTIFSTIREQIDRLEKDNIECDVIPGITSLLGAAASMNLELTLPGITQTIIITRAEFRTPVPDREKISELSKHGSTMAFYLSVHLLDRIIEELLMGGVYTNDTPVAIIYKATWKDQKILKGTIGTIARKVKEERIVKTALIVVGDVIAPKKYEFSKVYDSQFTHGYRKGINRNLGA